MSAVPALIGTFLLSLFVALLAALQLADYFGANEEFILILMGLPVFVVIAMAVLVMASALARRVMVLDGAAVFLALLQPGDTFMGLDLNSGGHLTHGSPVNMSGKWFNVVSYGVRQQDQLLDMDDIRTKALEHKPS